MDNDKMNSIKSLPWLVMYSNSGDIGILDILEAKQADSEHTGIYDFFVPLEITNLFRDGKTVQHKRLIAGHYIFIKATREDILRLRQEPPFDATLRFLHPATSPTGCIYVPESEIEMMRLVVQKMDGAVDYFAPTNKELAIGDCVRVLDGKFAGIRGILESVKGHEGGRLIVSLGDVLAVRTPKIAADDIQLIDLAKVIDTNGKSYTSRAYKKVRVLISDSERLLAEKQAQGALCEASENEAKRLILRFSQLKLGGKIRLMHAQAIYNILLALGDTTSELFTRYRNMLP
jgi:transcription antitermination factor NusG